MKCASLVILAALVACGDPAGPDANSGELEGAIIAGREQSVTAGASQLPEPVINQVVRASSGALLLRATASGTVVTGSPVEGAVVCVYEQDKDLVPFSRCTNTDAEGKATFFFAPPTKSGEYTARINGSVTTNGKVEATTFDTVKATVEPGPMVTPPTIGGTDRAVFVGASYLLTTLAPVTPGADAFGNAIVGATPVYTASAGATVSAGSLVPDSVGTQSIRVAAGSADVTRTLYAFDDPAKGLEISSKCLDATADSVVYRLSGTPTSSNGSVTLTSTAAFTLNRVEYQPGGTSTQSSVAGSWTVTQRADSAFATNGGASSYTFKRSAQRTYSADVGTLCPATFATRGLVRLSVKP